MSSHAALVDVAAVRRYLLDLQDQICTALLAEEPEAVKFREDAWVREAHEPLQGDGRTRILRNGAVFEQAGINFSHVQGNRLPPAATVTRPEITGWAFQALGISLVIHPQNPFVPTSHANVRLFVAEQEKQSVWWFGGGFDLTPYYPFDEDCIHWHRLSKAACDPFGEGLYDQFKRQCDAYFYLKHRQETRGIGGLFFDDFNEGSFENSFSLMKSVGNHYLLGYLPIVQRRKSLSFNERHRAFQLYRRGRYVEFNLLYDRGTLFGLQSGGRTESILMSLPPLVRWEYGFTAESGSDEAHLMDYLKPRDWLSP